MRHHDGVRAYVGVTDWEWYQSLSRRGATEANFWQPSGGDRFRAIPRGAPFLFKTHRAHGDRLVGVGYLSGWAALPVSQAWEFFGEDNGCSSEGEMRRRIHKYRGAAAVANDDPIVGCIMLRDITFVPSDRAPEGPPDWSRPIVRGKSYDLDSSSGSYVESAIHQILRLGTEDGIRTPLNVPGPVFGDPHLAPTRVGQAAFKALVQEAYGRRCAVTGDKIVPVLQAAHIRPVTDDGENRVDNGLLLRSDVHTLFDRGYLGVHPVSRRLLVSQRLRSDWGNGEEFYRRASSSEPIALPVERADQPNGEFLTWHMDRRFLT